jgi:hypothetical protein
VLFLTVTDADADAAVVVLETRPCCVVVARARRDFAKSWARLSPVERMLDVKRPNNLGFLEATTVTTETAERVDDD